MAATLANLQNKTYPYRSVQFIPFPVIVDKMRAAKHRLMPIKYRIHRGRFARVKRGTKFGKLHRFPTETMHYTRP